MKIMESELRGKTVMSDEGRYVGVMRNMTVNVETGELATLHVEPSEDADPRLYERDERGNIQFPFHAIRSVSDVVVVAANT